jgi:hypothetical protein
MATQPAMSGPAIASVPRRPRRAWLAWILFSVVGAILGALAAWQLRSLIQAGPSILGQDLAYAATALSVLIASGFQWFLLRRWRLDAYWWVPATVGANLVTVTFVVPPVFNLFYAQAANTAPMGIVILGAAAALAASGLVIGGVQSVVLRLSAPKIFWLWIPTTMFGGALAGALTTALSSQLFGLPAVATISLVAATSALLTSASQAPVVARILH